MKGFISVTEKYDGFNVLYPLSKITAIVSDSNGVFIETGCDKKGESTGIYTAETFDEIKEKINKSEV